jgi:hypothetical protein
LWKAEYQATGYASRASAGACNYLITLSTTNNSESNREYSSCGEVANTTYIGLNSERKDNIFLDLDTKTSYYLNIKTTRESITALAINATAREVIYIRATCAYL